MNEPTSAAIALAYEQTKANNKDDEILKSLELYKYHERNLLIFDIGGGTLDNTVLNITTFVEPPNRIKYNYTVKATSGDNCLGGKDFDDAILAFIKKRIQTQYNINDNDIANLRPIDNMMLRAKAEDLKISLATQSNFRIIANLFINGKDYNIDLEFSENEINQVVKPLTERMIKPFVEVIKQSKVSQIDDLLLIGGSGRLWCVQLILQRQMLKYSEIFKCAEISLATDSDLIVSKGNAIYGKFYNDPNTKIAITNINSFHIGMFSSIIFFIFIKLIRINHIF